MQTPSHTPRLNGKAAKRFFQRLVARYGEPRVVITDKLRSHIKPIKTLTPDADHRAHKGLNNVIEASHRPTRKREKMFGRFKSHRQAQRFLSAHDQINLIFRPRRYQLSATSYRHARNDAFSLWDDYATKMSARAIAAGHLSNLSKQLRNTVTTIPWLKRSSNPSMLN